MGFGWKDLATIGINPTVIGGTLLSGGLELYGAEQDRRATRDANQANIDLQREFAQSGVQWRVADAKAAGIHPLAALGASTPSFQASVMAEPRGDRYRALSKMGQDISRAVLTTQSKREREFIELENEVRLKKLRNENAILDFEFTNIGKPQGPSMPVAQTSFGDQMVESTENPGRFYLMPSMETAMASQGDWMYPLTNRLRKTYSHYNNLLGGKDVLDTRFAPMPHRYAKEGYDVWKREWDGMFVPRRKKEYGTKNW